MITTILTTKQENKTIDKHNADWALFSAKAELIDECYEKVMDIPFSSHILLLFLIIS